MHLRVSMTRIHNEVDKCPIRLSIMSTLFYYAHLDTSHIIYINRLLSSVLYGD